MKIIKISEENKKYFCSLCPAEVTQYNEYCSDCLNKLNGKQTKKKK